MPRFRPLDGQHWERTTDRSVNWFASGFETCYEPAELGSLFPQIPHIMLTWPRYFQGLVFSFFFLMMHILFCVHIEQLKGKHREAEIFTQGQCVKLTIANFYFQPPAGQYKSSIADYTPGSKLWVLQMTYRAWRSSPEGCYLAANLTKGQSPV